MSLSRWHFLPKRVAETPSSTRPAPVPKADARLSPVGTSLPRHLWQIVSRQEHARMLAATTLTRLVRTELSVTDKGGYEAKIDFQDAAAVRYAFFS